MKQNKLNNIQIIKKFSPIGWTAFVLVAMLIFINSSKTIFSYLDESQSILCIENLDSKEEKKESKGLDIEEWQKELKELNKKVICQLKAKQLEQSSFYFNHQLYKTNFQPEIPTPPPEKS